MATRPPGGTPGSNMASPAKGPTAVMPYSHFQSPGPLSHWATLKIDQAPHATAITTPIRPTRSSLGWFIARAAVHRKSDAEHNMPDTMTNAIPEKSPMSEWTGTKRVSGFHHEKND